MSNPNKKISILDKIKKAFIKNIYMDQIPFFLNSEYYEKLNYKELNQLLSNIKSEDLKHFNIIFEQKQFTVKQYTYIIFKTYELDKYAQTAYGLRILYKLVNYGLSYEMAIKLIERLMHFPKEKTKEFLYHFIERSTILFKTRSVDEIINLFEEFAKIDSQDTNNELKIIFDRDILSLDYESQLRIIKLYKQSTQKPQFINFLYNNLSDYYLSDIYNILNLLCRYNFKQELLDFVTIFKKSNLERINKNSSADSITIKQIYIVYTPEDLITYTEYFASNGYNSNIAILIDSLLEYNIPSSNKIEIITKLKNKNIDMTKNLLNRSLSYLFTSVENIDKDLNITDYITSQKDYDLILQLVLSLSKIHINIDTIKKLVNVLRIYNYNSTLENLLINEKIWNTRKLDEILSYSHILAKNGFNDKLAELIGDSYLLENLNMEEHIQILQKFISCNFNKKLFERVKALIIAYYEDINGLIQKCNLDDYKIEFRKTK